MIYINKLKTGIGYQELLQIDKLGGGYEDTKDDKSKNIFTRTNILKDLLSEQHFLCAYCMKKINLENATIEHIIGQKYKDNGIEIGKQYDTKYSNMLAVCDGKTCQNNLHCDKSRAKYQAINPLLNISPLNETQMKNIYFTRGGEVKYNVDNSDISNDINKILNLNCKSLVENRKRLIDAIYSELIRKKFNKKRISKLLTSLCDIKDSYYPVGVYFLRKYK